MKNIRTLRVWVLAAIVLGSQSGAVFAADPTPSTTQSPQAQQSSAPEVAEQRSGFSFKELSLMPVQSGGRIKPFDSFAREATLFKTGKSRFQGWDPIDLMLSWLTYPAYWQQTQFIKIARVDVRRQLGLEEKRTMFSPAELLSNFALLQYAQRMEQEGLGTVEALSGKTDRGNKATPREQELKQVFQRISLFREIIAGGAWTIVPQPGGKPWLNISTDDRAAMQIRTHFVELIKAYQAKDAAAFDRASTLTRAAVQGEIAGWNPTQERQIAAEVFYNRVHPFKPAWILYVLAAILWLMAPRKQDVAKSWKRTGAIWATVFAFAFQLAGILLRCYIAGRPPVTNMYESIIWVSFGTIIFAAILYWIQSNSILMVVASTMAAVGLIAADAAPAMMDPGLHPLVPVLRSNYWLLVHVLTITLSYSAFALSLGVGNVTLFHFFKQARARAAGNMAEASQLQAKITGLNLMTYRSMQFGIVLVAAGTILGGIWADESWGRFWGWDPKEVWALIVTLVYIAIVHGRMTNWIGPFAFAVCAVAGFLSVLMAWYGVNFILGVGLHSYGFASGGTEYVIAFTAVQSLYVAAIWGYRAVMEKREKTEPVRS